ACRPRAGAHRQVLDPSLVTPAHLPASPRWAKVPEQVRVAGPVEAPASSRLHPAYSSSCSILESTQSKRPLVTPALHYLHPPTWLISSGAPQLGQTLSRMLRPVVCVPTERWNVQYSTTSDCVLLPKMTLPFRSSTS